VNWATLRSASLSLRKETFSWPFTWNGWHKYRWTRGWWSAGRMGSAAIREARNHVVRSRSSDPSVRAHVRRAWPFQFGAERRSPENRETVQCWWLSSRRHCPEEAIPELAGSDELFWKHCV